MDRRASGRCAGQTAMIVTRLPGRRALIAPPPQQHDAGGAAESRPVAKSHCRPSSAAVRCKTGASAAGRDWHVQRPMIQWSEYRTIARPACRARPAPHEQVKPRTFQSIGHCNQFANMTISAQTGTNSDHEAMLMTRESITKRHDSPCDEMMMSYVTGVPTGCWRPEQIGGRWNDGDGIRCATQRKIR